MHIYTRRKKFKISEIKALLTQSHQTNKREPEKWQSNFDIDSGR
jgi:hypothetical protein